MSQNGSTNSRDLAEGEGHAQLYLDHRDYVENANGGRYFLGRDAYLSFLYDFTSAKAALDKAVKEKDTGHIEALLSGVTTTIYKLHSSKKHLDSLVQAYETAKTSQKAILDLVMKAQASIGGYSVPLTSNPSEPCATYIFYCNIDALSQDNAPSVARDVTGFSSIPNIETVKEKGVLHAVLSGLGNAEFERHPNFRSNIKSLASKGIFRGNKFPVDRVLCSENYSYTTMVYLIAFYLEVPDLYDHIHEVYLKNGLKFKAAEGDESPWTMD